MSLDVPTLEIEPASRLSFFQVWPALPCAKPRADYGQVRLDVHLVPHAHLGSRVTPALRTRPSLLHCTSTAPLAVPPPPLSLVWSWG